MRMYVLSGMILPKKLGHGVQESFAYQKNGGYPGTSILKSNDIMQGSSNRMIQEQSTTQDSNNSSVVDFSTGVASTIYTIIRQKVVPIRDDDGPLFVPWWQ